MPKPYHPDQMKVREDRRYLPSIRRVRRMVIWGLSTVFFFRDQSFKLSHLKLENEHPAGKKSDAFQHQQYQPIAMSHYITASASLDNIFCEREGVDSQYLITPTYNVCNGFSNQILGHAAFIAHSIKSSNMGSSHDKLKIPNAFIVNVTNDIGGDDWQLIQLMTGFQSLTGQSLQIQISNSISSWNDCTASIDTISIQHFANTRYFPGNQPANVGNATFWHEYKINTLVGGVAILNKQGFGYNGDPGSMGESFVRHGFAGRWRDVHNPRNNKKKMSWRVWGLPDVVDVLLSVTVWLEFVSFYVCQDNSLFDILLVHVFELRNIRRIDSKHFVDLKVTTRPESFSSESSPCHHTSTTHRSWLIWLRFPPPLPLFHHDSALSLSWDEK